MKTLISLNRKSSPLSHNLDQKVCCLFAGLLLLFFFYSCSLNSELFLQVKEDVDPFARSGTFTMSENRVCWNEGLVRRCCHSDTKGSEAPSLHAGPTHASSPMGALHAFHPIPKAGTTIKSKMPIFALILKPAVLIPLWPHLFPPPIVVHAHKMFSGPTSRLSTCWCLQLLNSISLLASRLFSKTARTQGKPWWYIKGCLSFRRRNFKAIPDMPEFTAFPVNIICFGQRMLGFFR